MRARTASTRVVTARKRRAGARACRSTAEELLPLEDTGTYGQF